MFSTARRVYPRAALLVAWPPCRGGSAGEIAVGATWGQDGSRPDGDGEYGFIVATFEAVNEPVMVSKTWNWLRPYDAKPHERGSMLLDPPSVVRMALIEDTDATGNKATTIHVEHLDVPIEWVEDLRTLWRWDLHRLNR
ncbi:hypothetical protein FB382_003727 [Nocardioides ginsengisegetis]|uniref:Uncharacterized protein n=1 Tax=Nocardioides ginsengisegetis TaxID=661491 RepID=A0A7W3PBD3_9ACTN|nr:hypothetical protein [Nocardioides ginsengisegetis]MBA8805436.1 hypothetical protein [Nocardioides ginsengisegetis]